MTAVHRIGAGGTERTCFYIDDLVVAVVQACAAKHHIVRAIRGFDGKTGSVQETVASGDAGQCQVIFGFHDIVGRAISIGTWGHVNVSTSCDGGLSFGDIRGIGGNVTCVLGDVAGVGCDIGIGCI